MPGPTQWCHQCPETSSIASIKVHSDDTNTVTPTRVPGAQCSLAREITLGAPHPYLWQICLLQPARRRPTAAAQGSVTINMAAGSVGEPPHSPWHPTQPQPQPHPLQPLKPPPAPPRPLLPSRVYHTPAWCYLRLLLSPPRPPGVSPSPSSSATTTYRVPRPFLTPSEQRTTHF